MALLGVLAVALRVLVAGTVASQLAEFRSNLPQHAAEIEQWVADLLRKNVDSGVVAAAQSVAGRVLALVSDFLYGVAGAVGDILGESLSLVFTLIVAVYLAADGERIQRYLLDFVPGS